MSSVVPEGWFSKSLDEVSIFIRDGTHGTHERLNEGIPLLSAKNISSDGHINCDSGDSLISEIDYQKIHAKYVIEKDDLLLTVVGTLGRTALVPKGFRKFTLQRSVAIIRLDAKTIHPELCYQYLSGDEFQRQLSLRSNSTAQAGVYLGELARISIPVPPLPEQKKIASILTSVDEVIENTQKQIDKLQDLKKATMNELLTKGIGHTEFKDSELGRIPKSWEVSLIGEVCEVGTGKKDTQNKMKYGKYPFFVRSQTIERIDSYSFDGEAILTAGDGVGTGKVFHYVNGRFDFHQRVYKLSHFRGGALGKFLYYCFSSRFLKQVQQFSARGSVESVRMEMITGMAIPLPSLQEQSKIVDCISAIETNISIGKQKLSQTQSLKKSLMQDLLTGKVRVRVN